MGANLLYLGALSYVIKGNIDIIGLVQVCFISFECAMFAASFNVPKSLNLWLSARPPLNFA